MKIERPRGPGGLPPEAPATAEAPAVPFAERLAGGERAAAAGPTERLQALVERLRSGEIRIEQALDALVEQSVAAAPLGPRGREQLRELLRAHLEADPTLSRLVREIDPR
jgi:hypothetical protein